MGRRRSRGTELGSVEKARACQVLGGLTRLRGRQLKLPHCSGYRISGASPPHSTQGRVTVFGPLLIEDQIQGPNLNPSVP